MKGPSPFYYLTAGLLLVALSEGCSSHPKNLSSGNPDEASQTKSFSLRPYTSEKLTNGLEILVIENHTLPSINFALLTKSGSASDPMAKAGLMNLMASALVKGTATRSAVEVANQLGELGSEFNQDVAQDYAWFQLDGLSQHQEKLFEIFSDVILHPRFDASEIEREKKNILASMAQRTDHPEQFAEQAFDAYLFGGHPYSRPVYGVALDVKGLKKKDLVRNYNEKVVPNKSVLVIAGDIQPVMLQKVRTVLGQWARHSGESQPFPAVPKFSGINIRLIDKPDLTQSQIIIGSLGIRRGDPDYLPLRLATTILGGDFSSRLMSQVRVKLGLTYNISSSFEARFDQGPFEISTFTKNGTVGQALSESLKVFQKFSDDGVSSEEVESAKNFMIGNFPRVIETPEKLGFNMALLRYYGISDDYLKNFIKNVAAITSADVNSAIKRHMDPKNLKILVLSNAAAATPQLRPLGLLEVKKFDQVF